MGVTLVVAVTRSGLREWEGRDEPGFVVSVDDPLEFIQEVSEPKDAEGLAVRLQALECVRLISALYSDFRIRTWMGQGYEVGRKERENHQALLMHCGSPPRASGAGMSGG